jgi:uncharacterized membrane protein
MGATYRARAFSVRFLWFDAALVEGYPSPAMARRTRLPGALGVAASVMGLFFAGFSTHDYAQNLDRQLHGAHCSFIPGLVAAEKGESGCTVAMYSPYSALLRDRFWGGVPISLFALGVYGLFLALALYLLLSGDRASKRTWQAFGITSFSPLVVSCVMFFIAATRLDHFCKLCIGLYVASAVLATSGVLALLRAGGSAAAPPPSAAADKTVRDDDLPWGLRPKKGDTVADDGKSPAKKASPDAVPTGSWLVFPAVLGGLALVAVAPAAVYAGSLPDYKPYLRSCGTIIEATEKHGALVKIPTSSPVQPALTFEDPLCPTCKAFHQRLVDEGLYDKLDLTVALFPLDSECNWMLDKPLHPGACILAKAVLCGDKAQKARLVLDWSYDNQEELREAGKAGADALRAKVKARFPDLDACIDAKETKQRLDRVLQFAVTNKIRVSTPQLFLGEQRVCDEDTDLGLRYAFGELAPKVKP